MLIDTLPPYPYNSEHGINFQEILTGSIQDKNTGRMLTPSGQMLNYQITPTWIGIYDDAFVDRVMEAGASKEENTAGFRIQTSNSPLDKIRHDFPWNRHPDMFAKAFIGVALNLFRRNGLNITTCRAVWHPLSDNHNEYKNQLKAGADNIKAAKATWTGKTLESYGYTELTGDDIEHQNLGSDYLVIAKFRKP